MTKVELNVLLVEDNPADVLFLREALEADPLSTFTLTAVETLADGLNQIQQHEYDVALVDLGLPDSTGLQTFERVHHAAPQMPVIVFSGNDDEQQAVNAVRAGAQDYLVKGLTGIEMAARTIRYAIERQKLQKKLGESEKRFATLFDSNPIPIGITRVPDYHIVDVNDAWTKLTGYTRDEAIGHTSTELGLAKPETLQKARDILDAQTTISENEILLYTRAGQERQILISTETIELGGETYFLTNLQDITARKQAEEKLRESEARFHGTLDAMQEGVLLIGWDWRYLYINKSAETQGQRPVGELLGKTVMECWPGIETTAFFQLEQKVMQGRLPAQIEDQFTFSNAETRWFQWNVQPAAEGLLIVTQDITERKQNEKLIRQWVDAFGNCAHGIAIGLPSTNQIMTCNPTFARLQGRTIEEISAMPILSMYALEDHAHVIKNIMEADRKGSISYEAHMVRKDGTSYPVQMDVVSVRDETGNILYRVATQQDITERKQSEDKLRESETLLRQVLESTQDAIFAIDRDYRLLINNEAHQQVLVATGGHRFQAGDNVLPTDYPPEMLADWRAMYDRAFSGEITHLELEWTDIYGKPRAYENNISPLRDAAGAIVGVLATAHDITERNQAEEQLRASEERYHQAIIAADAIPYALDYATNQYTFIGEGIEKVTGYAAHGLGLNEFSALLIESVVQGELKGTDPLRAIQLVRAGQAGGIWKCQHHIRARDGRELWVSDAAVQVLNDAGLPVGSIGILQDITEHKEIEKVLAERIQRATAEIQDLYDNAPAGYHSLDDNGCFVQINQTELNWLGYTRAEVIGRPLSDFVTDRGLATFKQKYPGFKQCGWLRDLKMEFLRKDGKTFLALVNATAIKDKDGHYLMSRSTVLDITEREQAEAALKASEAKYRLLFENMTEGFSLSEIITAENGQPIDFRFLDANEAYGRHTGTPAREVIGKTLLEIMPQADPHQIQRYGKVALTGEPLAYEYYSQSFHRHFSVRAFSPKHGQFATIFEDISERKQAEQVLRDSRDRLDLANRELERASRAKDEFLANMSHELRTPLNSILGMAQSLGEQYIGPLNPRQLEAVTIIEASGRHLLELINDILDLSKIESGNVTLDLTTIDVPTICRASLLFVKQAAYRKNIQVSSRFDEAVTWLSADERRLKQMLVNLLNNAVKFTPEGGQVELSVKGERAARTVQFAIRDTGIGIAPADLSRLFKPFVQLDGGLTRQYEGTGLGLSIVLSLAQLHGGDVTVDSEPGRGSVFTITLPWADNGPTPSGQTRVTAASTPVAVPAPRPDQPAPLILIAEDNEANILMLCTHLETRGYRLSVARHGGEVLEKIQTEPPALILMDLQMPVMDGLEATRRLRSEPDPAVAGIPVIALTALARPTDRDRALAAGANAFLSKPIDLQQLAELIQAMLKEY